MATARVRYRAGVLDGNDNAVRCALDGNGERAAGRHGVDGVAYEIGEHLHDLAFAQSDIRRRVEAACDADASGLQSWFIDANDLGGDVGERGADDGGGVAIVAESLLRDVRDAGDFAFGGGKVFGLCGSVASWRAR